MEQQNGQRKLAFRAWDVNKKSWIDFSDIERRITFNCSNNNRMDWWLEDALSSMGIGHDIILLQYTGLKDKKGKEIYEGDIVEYKDFSNGARFAFSGEDIQPRARKVIKVENLFNNIYLKGCGFVTNQKDSEKKLEVIGNKYENPELLD